MTGGGPGASNPRGAAVKPRAALRDAVRVAWECGFQWALECALADPAVPPARDVVALTLTEPQAAAALLLLPTTWWQAWAAGWAAGAGARHDLEE